LQAALLTWDVMAKEAKARIKINKLLESAGWRFFDNEVGKANILLKFNTTFQLINDENPPIIKKSLPSLDIQKIISEKIDKEQQLVNANKELITIFEQKIKDRIARVWGE